MSFVIQYGALDMENDGALSFWDRFECGSMALSWSNYIEMYPTGKVHGSELKFHNIHFRVQSQVSFIN